MKIPEPLTPEQIAKRRDDAIRRAMNTPPKRNEEFVGKSGREPRPRKKTKQK